MTAAERLATVDRASDIAADCNGHLQSVAAVLAMADGSEGLDANHAIHCAELIIEMVRERLNEVETSLGSVSAQMRGQA